MSIGKIRDFNVKTGSWLSYADRLDMYFQANGIKEELKMPTLISLMGDESYELLMNLASPKKPSELTYTAAKEILRNHLQPAPSLLAERYRFRQRRQRGDENAGDYVAELKKLARNCKFKDGLEDNLRDQFVCGLKSDVIRQRLFAEDDSLTYAKALKLAISLEAAERDAAAVEDKSQPGTAGSADLHALNAREQRAGRARWARGGGGAGRGGSQNGSAQRSEQRGNCKGCGATGHDIRECRFRDYVCSRCKRPGHLRRVCPNEGVAGASGAGRPAAAGRGFHYGQAAGDHSESDEEPEEELYLHQLCLKDYRAVSLPLNIDGKIIRMEVDTGTAISCISKSTYDRYFCHLVIQPHKLCLTFYDGSKIRPLGFIKPVVEYQGISKELELFVIEGGTTSLLGRQWLTELKIGIPTLDCFNMASGSFKNIHINNEICTLLDRYKQLFDGSLGRFTGGKATLRVREGAAPVFHRARPLPFALRERVDAELDAMLRAGVIEPVDCSDWASPLVPVNKSDGTLRICVDYKGTLNPALLVDRFPLPRIDDVLVALNGAQYFSKIDLSQSYNQIELDESKRYTVINSHRGLFRYNRLVYGLSSSPGIFQRIMTTLLEHIPNVAVFIDDVIIGGKSKTEHLKALEMVFKRLRDSGLKLKGAKCVFLVQEVSYLGYILSKDGIKADPSKIEAVIKIPRPQNVPELRSFLGLANFFAKFVNNFSLRLVPLYNLLKKGIEWSWTEECEQVFKGVKKDLVSSKVLAHYDPNKPLVVTCDASAAGVGGVLSQPSGRGDGSQRPVAFVSRTLTNAEKNYSQIHREALAIIFCMKKFHQYIFGRRFTLLTDHKPLVSIFGPDTGIPSMTASRMQRWAIILSAYTYDIEYVKTDNNSADGLSRLPLPDKKPVSGVLPEQTHLHHAQEAMLLDYNEIKSCTAKDPMMSRVLGFIRNGWPAECDIVGLQPYYNRRNELYEELGCIMWGHRLIIPDRCRQRVLKMLHEPHMGIVKSKALARSYVWWAGIDEAVEGMCRACATCAAQADAPPRQAPRPWMWPRRPWSRLHLDFLGPVFGKTYLVVVDAMSKWIEIFCVPSTAAVSTIEKLRELWSRWGIPKQIVTDNGPPFTSSEFAAFLGADGVEHTFSAPYHPASNGAAENAVKTLKRVIKKADFEKENIMKALHTFLLFYRNTEHASTGESPAMLMLGRPMRTRLDALKPNLESRISRVQRRQVENAGGAERTVDTGDEVWYRQFLKGEKWIPGRVGSQVGPSNFRVIDEGGKQVHRHIDQIKRRTRSSLICPDPGDTVVGSAERTEIEPGINSGTDVPVRISDARSSEQLEIPITTGTAEPKLIEPLSVQPPNEGLAQPRPIRQCRQNKPNYKL